MKQCIENARSLFHKKLKNEFAVITTYFQFLIDTITKVEKLKFVKKIVYCS